MEKGYYALQGRNLTALCRSIHTEFAAAAGKFAASEVDIWDLGNEGFKADITSMRDQAKELDKRLAAIILQVSVACLLSWLQSLYGRTSFHGINLEPG